MKTPEKSVEEISWQKQFLDDGIELMAEDLSIMIPTVSKLLQAERQRCEEMVEAEYDNGVKQTIAQFLRMNLENPKAPVNVDEVKRRALSERV